ncbi:hypothetical protein Sste5346_005515 [Sporothrix stenoceras]|uniref:Uncharacterized protein n=1 Tax=Sporothrix stenoceras TaxID=5173 RepID=A0ABR3Z5L0_9PEZI
MRKPPILPVLMAPPTLPDLPPPELILKPATRLTNNPPIHKQHSTTSPAHPDLRPSRKPSRKLSLKPSINPSLKSSQKQKTKLLKLRWKMPQVTAHIQRQRWMKSRIQQIIARNNKSFPAPRTF